MNLEFLLLNIAMRFVTWLEESQAGKSLAELGERSPAVKIYRATPQQDTNFNNMDYVTRSLKFAREHADHQVVVNEESFVVIETSVSPEDVKEAYNPGEYFYTGQTRLGNVIYTAHP